MSKGNSLARIVATRQKTGSKLRQFVRYTGRKIVPRAPYGHGFAIVGGHETVIGTVRVKRDGKPRSKSYKAVYGRMPRRLRAIQGGDA